MNMGGVLKLPYININFLREDEKQQITNDKHNVYHGKNPIQGKILTKKIFY